MTERNRLTLINRLAALASLALIISACGNGDVGSITAVVPTESISTPPSVTTDYTATPGVLAPDATIDIYGSSTPNANLDGGSSEILSTPLDTAGTAVNTLTATVTATATATPNCTRLNVNSATADQLTQGVPNITAELVQAILATRPYGSIQQFRSTINSTADTTIATPYEDYLYVPVDPNLADRATLMQIPGVDVNSAAILIGGRPYAAPAAFLSALGTSITGQQLADASCFLIAQ